MKRPQFTLFQMMVATAVIAALLAAVVNANEDVVRFFICCPAIPLLAVTASYFWFKRVPYRVRLPVEILTMMALLAISATIWAPCYDRSRSAAEISIIASNLADAVDSPSRKNRYRRIAAKFTSKASALRWKALWLGLIRGPYGCVPLMGSPMSGQELIQEFEFLEAKHQLEADWKELQEQRVHTH